MMNEFDSNWQSTTPHGSYSIIQCDYDNKSMVQKEMNQKDKEQLTENQKCRNEVSLHFFPLLGFLCGIDIWHSRSKQF